MSDIFSDRISDVPVSFIREILKSAVDPGLISFAGGLPNRNFFPVEEIRRAADAVLSESGAEVLQYATSEGYEPLRKWISERYRARGVEVPVHRIIITTGSQQALDLAGKVLVNDGDSVAIEEPGYLGAIQALSLYRPQFYPVPLTSQGPDLDAAEAVMFGRRIKLFYTVPNFQNPSGLTHSEPVRQRIVELLANTKTFLIEDNPYGEIRFAGTQPPSYGSLLPSQTILLGSFSKIFAPAFRIGWMAVPETILDKVVIAKQAADLHTDYFAQRILYRFLQDNDIDAHIRRISAAYGAQKAAMVDAIRTEFPAEVAFTEPEGGMFLWADLPSGLSSRALFDLALVEKVAFVPGDPFYTTKGTRSTLRLNFSSVDPETIREGIRRLGKVFAEAVEGTRAQR